MINEHVYDLIPGFALGILDDEDRLSVIEHLKLCDDCRRELEGYRQVVDQLPMAMYYHQPPEHLKDHILSNVKRATKQEVVSTPSFWTNLRQFLVGTAPVWGAAGLMVLLILAVSNLFLLQRLNQLGKADQHELISVSMIGTEITPDAIGMLVMSPDGDYGVLVSDGLPELGEAEQYQLWLIEDGARTSGGIFSVNKDGYGNLIVSADQPLTIYDSFGVTVEPAGGSPGPTGVKVLGSEF